MISFIFIVGNKTRGDCLTMSYFMKFEEFSDAAVAVLICLGRVTKMTQFINLSHSNEIFGHNFFFR
jgi:hypothetical protein